MRSVANIATALSLLSPCSAYDWIFEGTLQERLDRVPACYWPCIPEGIKAMHCDSKLSQLACLSGSSYIFGYQADACEKKQCSQEDISTWYYAVVDIQAKYNTIDATDEEKKEWSKEFDDAINAHHSAPSTAGKSSGDGKDSTKKESGGSKGSSVSASLLVGLAGVAFLAL